MTEKQEILCNALEKLFAMKNRCSSELFYECNLSNFTVKQLEYLRIIDEYENMTFSMLSIITKNSKPTITEIINKFIKMKVVIREKSVDDGRVYYIRLTEKGQTVARIEKNSIIKLLDKMSKSLNEDEMELFVRILNKIE